MSSAACSWSVSKSRCWLVASGVAAGDPRLGAAAGEVGGHAHLAVAAAEAERGPVELAVTLHLGALRGEQPGLLGEVLRGDVMEAGVLAYRQLHDSVEQGVGLVGLGAVVLPDLGPGAFLEHDQRAPVDSRSGVVELQIDLHRLVAGHVARHVDQHAVGPVGLVAGDEGVFGRDQRAEVGAEQVGMLGERFGERHDDDLVASAGDLHFGRGVLVGVEIESAQVGELPALVLLRGQRERLDQRGAGLAALGEPPGFVGEPGFGDRCLSQSIPPSGARSAGSARPHTPSEAPW